MDSFEQYLDNTFDLVDVLKSSEQDFVVFVYDKKAQRLCTMKQRDLRSVGIYKTLKELNNPHVPEIYRIFQRNGKLIVVEEHIDGQTLEELLIYRPFDFDEKFVLEILKQMCECLSVIHALNIVNRDIKPSNIMLTKAKVVKVIDFGIARTFKPDSTSDTEFLGTRGYASPEQFGLFDFGQTDKRSDIYSLGITIKQLLGNDYRGWLLSILNRCSALEPSERYQSVFDILNAIDTKRRWRIFKKVFIIGATFLSVMIPPVVTKDILIENIQSELEEEYLIADTESKVDKAEVINKSFVKGLNQSVLDQLIDFSRKSHNALPTQNSLPEFQPSIEIKPLPSPAVSQRKANAKPRESFDGIDLYFYLNGSLTGTDGSHFIDIQGWRSWCTYDNGVLFPADWQALLHIENHSGTDLVEPLITVSFGKDKYSVGKSTVKVGQSLDLSIPIGEKFAAPFKGTGHLQIVVQVHGMKPIYLNRTFRLI